MIKHLILPIFLLLFTGTVFAAKSSVDQFPKDAKELLDKANDVTLDYSVRTNASQSLYNLGVSRMDTMYLIEATYCIVKVLHDQGKYAESIGYLDHLLELETDVESENYAFILNKYGLTYFRLGLKGRSVSWFTKAKEIFALNNNEDQRLACINNISSVYYHYGDHESAIQSMKELIEPSKRLGKSLGTLYYNLGTCYLHRDKYEDALFYLKKAEEEGGKAGNAKDGMSRHAYTSQAKLALAYAELNNFERSDFYLNESKKGMEELVLKDKISIYLDIIDIDLIRKKWAKAKKELDKVEKVLQETNMNNYKGQILIRYSLLAKETGNIDEYFAFESRFRKFSDSLMKIRNLEELRLLDNLVTSQRDISKLKGERQKLKIKDQEKSLQILEYERNTYRAVFWSLLIGLLLIIAVVWLRYRVKQSRIRNEQLKSKTEELSSTLKVKKEQLTSMAIYLGQNRDFLARLKRTLKKIRSNELDRVELDELIVNVTEIHSISKDQQKFYELIEHMNAEFFAEITKKYPELTRNDIQLIGLLKLDLSSKEIASLTNISAKSVDVKRHRLRKKLNLERSVSLTDIV